MSDFDHDELVRYANDIARTIDDTDKTADNAFSPFRVQSFVIGDAEDKNFATMRFRAGGGWDLEVNYRPESTVAQNERWVVKPWHPELAYPTDEDAVAWYAQDTVLGYCTAPSRDLEGVETEVRRRNREDTNQAGILIRDDGTPMGEHLKGTHMPKYRYAGTADALADLLDDLNQQTREADIIAQYFRRHGDNETADKYAARSEALAVANRSTEQ